MRSHDKHLKGTHNGSERSEVRLLQLVKILLVIALLALLVTYVDFVQQVRNSVKSQPAKSADGIVVLTGDSKRITTAMDVLNSRMGERLLISGVNQNVSRDTLEHKVTGKSRTFSCCVDLDYLSMDTRDNAEYASYWANFHEFDRLLVVTSDYHMPRSLLMMKRSMPRLDIIPAAVPSLAAADKSLAGLALSPIILREFSKYLIVQLGMESAADYMRAAAFS